MGAHDATSCSTAAAGSDGASDAHRPAPDDAPDQPLPGAFLLMLVPHLGGDLATLQALRASSRAARDAVDAATTDLRVSSPARVRDMAATPAGLRLLRSLRSVTSVTLGRAVQQQHHHRHRPLAAAAGTASSGSTATIAGTCWHDLADLLAGLPPDRQEAISSLAVHLPWAMRPADLRQALQLLPRLRSVSCGQWATGPGTGTPSEGTGPDNNVSSDGTAAAAVPVATPIAEAGGDDAAEPLQPGAAAAAAAAAGPGSAGPQAAAPNLHGRPSLVALDVQDASDLRDDALADLLALVPGLRSLRLNAMLRRPMADFSRVLARLAPGLESLALTGTVQAVRGVEVQEPLGQLTGLTTLTTLFTGKVDLLPLVSWTWLAVLDCPRMQLTHSAWEASLAHLPNLHTLSVFSFSLAPDDPDDPLDPGGQGHDLYLAAHGAALQIMTAAQATSDAAPATPAAEVVAARPATVECAGAGAGPVLSSSAWVYGSGSWDAGGKATAGPVGTDAPGALGTTPAAAAAGTGPGSAPQDDGPACTPSAGTETPAAARAVAPSWPPVLRSLRSLTVASPVAYPGPLCYLLGGLPGPSMAVLRLSCYASPEAMIDPLGQRLCPMLACQLRRLPRLRTLQLRYHGSSLSALGPQGGFTAVAQALTRLVHIDLAGWGRWVDDDTVEWLTRRAEAGGLLSVSLSRCSGTSAAAVRLLDHAVGARAHAEAVGG